MGNITFMPRRFLDGAVVLRDGKPDEDGDPTVTITIEIPDVGRNIQTIGFYSQIGKARFYHGYTEDDAKRAMARVVLALMLGDALGMNDRQVTEALNRADAQMLADRDNPEGQPIH